MLGKATGTATSAVALYRMLAEQGLRTLGIGSAEGLSLPFVGIPQALTGMASAKRSVRLQHAADPQMKAFGKAHATTLNDLLLATLDIALTASGANRACGRTRRWSRPCRWR